MTPGQRYLALRVEIAELAKKYERNPEDITLIAVSKGHPKEHLESIYQAGARDFGESRVQEASEKIAATPTDIHWHLIGTLQRKKVPKAVGAFSLIHSVDSPELANKIATIAKEQNKQQSILLQVNTSGEKSKHGLTPQGWRNAVQDLLKMPSIKIEGLMTMAPLTNDKAIIRHCFAELRAFRDELGLKHLSMGMSQDYSIAIAEGATMLRIGTTLFGS